MEISIIINNNRSKYFLAQIIVNVNDKIKLSGQVFIYK